MTKMQQAEELVKTGKLKLEDIIIGPENVWVRYKVVLKLIQDYEKEVAELKEYKAMYEGLCK